jgi:hypothetical protein
MRKGKLMYARSSTGRRRKFIERVGVTVSAGGLALVALAVFGVTAASSASSRAGDAAIVDPSGTANPLASGKQITPWTIKLPAAAACSGNTSQDGYHSYGFVIPASADPLAMTFDPANGPNAPALPLFDQSGTQYGPANTAVSPSGQITQIPTFDWMKFNSTFLPAGAYKVGIICADKHSAVDKYWDVPVTFTSTLDWTATNPAPGGGGGPTTTTTAPPGGGTTTTTPGGVTTTTAGGGWTGATTTTTTGGTGTTTTSTGSTDTSTTSPAVAAASFGAAQPAALAATGSPSVTLVILGVVLFSLGLAIVVLTRRQGPVAAGKDLTT